MNTQRTTINAKDRAHLLAYVKQHADNGAYAALLADVLINTTCKGGKASNLYNLSPFQREVLYMIHSLGSVGIGCGMAHAIERLDTLGLIKPMKNGFYEVTDEGRRIASGQGGG